MVKQRIAHETPSSYHMSPSHRPPGILAEISWWHELSRVAWGLTMPGRTEEAVGWRLEQHSGGEDGA